MNGYYSIGDVVLEEWTLVRFINEGSYGRVFEAIRKDGPVELQSAIKVITIPQNQSEVDAEKLNKSLDDNGVAAYFKSKVDLLYIEIGLMSKMRGHSNVVSYEDHKLIKHSNSIGWDIIIRMELLTPLTDYIRMNGITAASIVKIGIDICSALELCKKNNIIHQDIKPENTFVSNSGDFKLGDFSIARKINETPDILSLKTPINMTPGMYRNEPSVDTYSLGLMLYRLLNNMRLPFLPDPPAPITYQDEEAAWTKISSGVTLPLPRNDNGRLAQIVLRACSYNPENRYSNPTQMREELVAVSPQPHIKHKHGSWISNNDGTHICTSDPGNCRLKEKCLPRGTQQRCVKCGYRTNRHIPATIILIIVAAIITASALVWYFLLSAGKPPPPEHVHGNWSSNNDGTHSCHPVSGDCSYTEDCSPCGPGETCDLCGYSEHVHGNWVNNNNGTHSCHPMSGVCSYTEDCSPLGSDETCDLCGYSEHVHGNWKSNGDNSHRCDPSIGECSFIEACSPGDPTSICVKCNAVDCRIILDAQGRESRLPTNEDGGQAGINEPATGWLLNEYDTLDNIVYTEKQSTDEKIIFTQRFIYAGNTCVSRIDSDYINNLPVKEQGYNEKDILVRVTTFEYFDTGKTGRKKKTTEIIYNIDQQLISRTESSYIYASDGSITETAVLYDSLGNESLTVEIKYESSNTPISKTETDLTGILKIYTYESGIWVLHTHGNWISDKNGKHRCTSNPNVCVYIERCYPLTPGTKCNNCPYHTHGDWKYTNNGLHKCSLCNETHSCEWEYLSDGRHRCSLCAEVINCTTATPGEKCSDCGQIVPPDVKVGFVTIKYEFYDINGKYISSSTQKIRKNDDGSYEFTVPDNMPEAPKPNHSFVGWIAEEFFDNWRFTDWSIGLFPEWSYLTPRRTGRAKPLDPSQCSISETIVYRSKWEIRQ